MIFTITMVLSYPAQIREISPRPCFVIPTTLILEYVGNVQATKFELPDVVCCLPFAMSTCARECFVIAFRQYLKIEKCQQDLKSVTIKALVILDAPR